MSGADDEDLREFQGEQRRVRRRNAVVLAAVGTVLIPVAVAVRRWAEALDAEQAASNVQFDLPTRVIVASWGAAILGATCLLVALLLFARTLGGAGGRR